MQSNANAVYDFTTQSGTKCPDTPEHSLDRSQVLFIIRMVFSEMDELACTVSRNKEEANNLLLEALKTRDPCKNFEYTDTVNLIGAQGDAMVDAWYYMLNSASKKGVDLSKIFNAVHKANMAKKDPTTNKFIRRDDGKILKPLNWQPADIVQVVKDM